MDDSQEWFNARGLMYTFLSVFYRGELQRGLNFLGDTTILQELSKCHERPALAAAAQKLLAETVGQEDRPEYMERLAADYQRLFIGPGSIPAPPWESVYCSREKLLFGEPDLLVRHAYRRDGLMVKHSEPADHIALELAFMAYLCRIGSKEKKRFYEILHTQQNFLEEHLLQWISRWGDDIIQNSQTVFWRNLAAVALEWLNSDFRDLQEIQDGVPIL